MKRIKIIDIPRYETDPKVIVEHLTKFLTKVRKDMVTADLIGDDERSEQFDAKDFDFFGDALSMVLNLRLKMCGASQRAQTASLKNVLPPLASHTSKAKNTTA